MVVSVGLQVFRNVAVDQPQFIVLITGIAVTIGKVGAKTWRLQVSIFFFQRLKSLCSSFSDKLSVISVIKNKLF